MAVAKQCVTGVKGCMAGAQICVAVATPNLTCFELVNNSIESTIDVLGAYTCLLWIQQLSLQILL